PYPCERVSFLPLPRIRPGPATIAGPAACSMNLDRALAAAAADLNLDLPGLGLLGLGNPDLQHAVLVRRAHFVGLHRLAELEAALEGAVGALHVMPLHVLRFRALAALAAHGQGVLEHRDLHVLR